MHLRPLRFSEIFDLVLSTSFKRFATFAALVLLVAVPVRAVQVAILAAAVSNPDDITNRSAFASQTGDPTNGTVAVNLTTSLLGALALVLGTAVCFKAASAGYLGTRAGWRSSFDSSRPQLGPVVWTAIIGGIGVLAGLIAFVLPGIWLGVAWSVAIPALLFERLGPMRALGRSFELVRGRWWPTFGVLVTIGLLAGILSAIVKTGSDALLTTSLGNHVFLAALIDAAGGVAGNVVAVPIQAVAVAVLYYDLRARKESLEPDVIARRLDLVPGEVEVPKAAIPGPPAPRVPEPGPAGVEPTDGEPVEWVPPAPPSDAPPPGEWAPPRPPSAPARGEDGESA
jgi:hypothetical protein